MLEYSDNNYSDISILLIQNKVQIYIYIYVHNITLTRWYKYMLKPNVLTVEFLSHQFHLCFYQRMSRLGKTKITLC